MLILFFLAVVKFTESIAICISVFVEGGEKQGQWLCMFVQNALQIVFYPMLMGFGSNSIYWSIPFSQLVPVLQ